MSPRTRKALPTIEPIVPVAGSLLLHDPQWIYEPKFDGFPLLDSIKSPMSRCVDS